MAVIHQESAYSSLTSPQDKSEACSIQVCVHLLLFPSRGPIPLFPFAWCTPFSASSQLRVTSIDF